MAALDWPASLPKPNDGGFSEGRVNNFISDESQVGAPRRRARFTRTLKKFAANYTLTETQKDALLTFYDTTTSGGVAEFNWTHPGTAAVHEVRFSSDGGMQISHRTVNYWDVAVSLEEI
jgi:hypothetical protein